MGARVVLDGLSDLRAALQQLPEELAAEANEIVASHALAAQQQIQAAYPQGPTGNLKKLVSTTVSASRFGGAAIVKSRAAHASLFEKGTVLRRTAKGFNRGRMPAASPAEAFIPKAIRARKAMNAGLIVLVQRAGFEVDGEP